MVDMFDGDDKLAMSLGIDRDALPPNSDAYKSRKAEEADDDDMPRDREQPKKKEKPEFSITKREKTFGEKLKEAVFGENVKNVPEHVFFNIIIPNVMRMFGDSITGALNMTFRNFGRSISRDRDDDSPYRRYDRDYDRRRSERRAPSGADIDFDDYIFSSREGVEYVIDRLNDLLDRYPEITVANVCDEVGRTPRSIDNKWGWRSVRDFEAARVDGGWVLSVPRPRYLD